MTRIYAIADIMIDPDTRQVSRGGEDIDLPDLSFDLLLRLVMEKGDPVDTLTLAQDVWRQAHVSDDTIAQRIALLRKALGDDPKKPSYLRTVRGRGYALARRPEIQKSSPETASTSRIHRLKPVYAAAGASLLLLAVAGFVIANQPQSPDRLASDTTETLIERAQTQLRLHQSTETDRAIAMLRNALELEPDNSRAMLRLSFALSTRATKFIPETGDVAEAESLARTVLGEGGFESNAWSALAYALDAQGRMDEALAAYRHAYEVNPDNYPALSSAAYLLSVRGRLYEALLLEARGLETGKSSLYAEIQISRSLELLDQEAAEIWRDRAVLLNPGQVMILGELAEIGLKAQDPDRVLAALDQASPNERQTPRLLRYEGRALLQAGDRQGARRAFEAAGFRAEYDLAALMALEGDGTLAQALLAEAREKMLAGDSAPELRVRLAEIEAALCNEAAALTLLSQAVDLGWRDAGQLRTSPFLQAGLGPNDLEGLEERIERELEAQRSLVLSSEALQSILHPAS